MCAGSVRIHTWYTNSIMRYTSLRHYSMPYHRVLLSAATATKIHIRRFRTSNIKPYKCKHIALPPVYENKFRAWHFIGSRMYSGCAHFRAIYFAIFYISACALLLLFWHIWNAGWGNTKAIEAAMPCRSPLRPSRFVTISIICDSNLRSFVSTPPPPSQQRLCHKYTTHTAALCPLVTAHRCHGLLAKNLFTPIHPNFFAVLQCFIPCAACGICRRAYQTTQKDTKYNSPFLGAFKYIFA